MPLSSRDTSIFQDRFIVGCFLVFALPLLLYLVHGIFILGEASQNQAKWQEKGSRDYTIAASLIALPAIWGEVQVKNGSLVSANSGGYGQLGSLDSYRVLTVDGLFDKVRSYAFMPFCWETVTYDSVYGYPAQATFNCLVEGEGGFKVEHIDLAQ